MTHEVKRDFLNLNKTILYISLIESIYKNGHFYTENWEIFHLRKKSTNLVWINSLHLNVATSLISPAIAIRIHGRHLMIFGWVVEHLQSSLLFIFNSLSFLDDRSLGTPRKY